MDRKGNNSLTRTPAWGAPAHRSTPINAHSPNVCSQQNPFRNNQYFQHNHTPNSLRSQRSSPYWGDRGRSDNMSNTFQNNQKQDDSPTFHNQDPNFSTRNPFVNKGPNFSSDNPFQSKGQNFSPGNPFQNKSQYSSPNHQTLIQPNFQSSPPHHTHGSGKHSFSSRTPGNNFYTPSPRQLGYKRNSSDSSKRYEQRNTPMGNPGGSNNIKDYVNPKMLEDPWKDLPPVPILQSY